MIELQIAISFCSILGIVAAVWWLFLPARHLRGMLRSAKNPRDWNWFDLFAAQHTIPVDLEKTYYERMVSLANGRSSDIYIWLGSRLYGEASSAKRPSARGTTNRSWSRYRPLFYPWWQGVFTVTILLLCSFVLWQQVGLWTSGRAEIHGSVSPELCNYAQQLGEMHTSSMPSQWVETVDMQRKLVIPAENQLLDLVDLAHFIRGIHVRLALAFLCGILAAVILTILRSRRYTWLTSVSLGVIMLGHWLCVLTLSAMQIVFVLMPLSLPSKVYKSAPIEAIRLSVPTWTNLHVVSVPVSAEIMETIAISSQDFVPLWHAAHVCTK